MDVLVQLCRSPEGVAWAKRAVYVVALAAALVILSRASPVRVSGAVKMLLLRVSPGSE
jgi:hypothetical protein